MKRSKRLFSSIFALIFTLVACHPTNGELKSTTAEDLLDPVILSELRAESQVKTRYVQMSIGREEDLPVPSVLRIKSGAELEKYYDDQNDSYDESFWSQNELILVLLEEASGSYRHVVKEVAKEDGVWSVCIDRLCPLGYTMDLEYWLLLIEMPKEKIAEGEEIRVKINDVQVKEILDS